MSKTFDQGKDAVARLSQYFATNRLSFVAPGVKEAHVRQSLIDPFFEALGWDVRNDAMTAPQYREVIPEDSLDVEGQQKAPDYTFRVGTLPKFYVEAKKCGVNISADPGPAYQLRRYGFSAKLALSILTDFDELGVYDCAARPRPGDKASHARIQYFGFAEYPDRWREIWDVFSREAVWSGKFDQYAASKRKRGTSEVDSEFLKDIEGWRDVLARNLALRNSDLLTDDLNAAVQRIIDRIVFLRMAEDRGLESYGQLLKLCDQPDIYARFMSGLCRKADDKYNSGLFHFQKEAGVSDAPDTLTPRLAVDDKALKPILQSLYFEHGSPYNFGVLPVEILGTVYERFLGKVIRLTAGHQAKVEEKPEVRKAGGVYYTPAYIVKYIVLNTVGKQIEGKSPADLAGGKTTPPFRVLDMACGSGSFLLGAYQCLLEHCLSWYQANPSPKYAKAVYQNAKGETCLTIAERKRILTTHIFGVDIDQQAVEVTKLSLLLKALEGENDATLTQQMTFFHERALPNLSQNIKCGNSLVASDFSLIPEELVRVHAFDWPVQFTEAIKAGGFDAVIGNPPYVLIESGAEKEYLRHTYESDEGKPDLYKYFIEQSHRLLRQGGRFGMIIPASLLTTPAYRRCRAVLLKLATPAVVVAFRGSVFEDAQVNCIVLVTNRGLGGTQVDWIEDDAPVPSETSLHQAVAKASRLDLTVWRQAAGNVFSGPETARASWIAKISGACVPLSNLGNYTLGMQVYHNTIHSRKEIEQRISHAAQPGKGTWLRESRGTNVKRYEFVEEMEEWVEYGKRCYNQPAREFSRGPRLVIREITGETLNCAYTDTEHMPNKAVIVFRSDTANLRFILGVLNSKLIGEYVAATTEKGRQRLFPRISLRSIRTLPVPKLDLSCPTDRARHDRMVTLVDKMLALTPKLHGATSESEKAALQNAVTTTDAEINRLVYELYGLTEEEIKLVEGEC